MNAESIVGVFGKMSSHWHFRMMLATFCQRTGTSGFSAAFAVFVACASRPAAKLTPRYSVRSRFRRRFERLWKADYLRRFQRRIVGLRFTAK